MRRAKNVRLQMAGGRTVLGPRVGMSNVVVFTFLFLLLVVREADAIEVHSLVGRLRLARLRVNTY